MWHAKFPDKIAVWLLAVFVLTFTGLFCFFTPRTEMFDELVLLNPMYMFLNYGKITYPIEGFFNSLVIHPPTHYLNIALLMKLGINSYYAVTLPAFIFTFLALWAIISGPFLNYVKCALIMGLGGPMLMEYYIRNLESFRVDYTLALVWYCSLIILESARLENWNTKKLFLGAFLITYCSGMHYYASFAFTGLIFYFMWGWKSKGFESFFPKMKAMVLGSCLFGIPYLFLYILPNIQDIYMVIEGHQNAFGDGGILQSIERHISHYKTLGEEYSFYTGRFSSLSQPWKMWLACILFLAGPLLLFIFPPTRGMALACLPLPFFVFVNARAKSEGYYVPEVMIYLTGLAMLGFSALAFVRKRLLPPPLRSFLLLFSVVILIPYVISKNFSQLDRVTFKHRDYEMHLARACAIDILGDNALVGSRMGLWYISGGQRWYDVQGDILSPDDVSQLNLSSYFSKFDAIADHNAGSNVTWNKQKITISSCYADSILNVLGFYLTNNKGVNSDLSFLLLSTIRQKPIKGYVCFDNKKLIKVEGSENGDHLFFSFICPKETDISNFTDRALLFNTIPLPKSEAPTSDWEDYTHQIVWMIIPASEFLKIEKSEFTGLQIRDEIKCNLKNEDKNSLLQRLKKDHQPMRFFKTYKEAVSSS